MRLDGLHADVQLARDLLVRVAARDEAEHLALTNRELVELGVDRGCDLRSQFKVLDAQGLPSAVTGRLGSFGLAISIGGHQVSLVESLVIITAFGLAVNALAVWLVSLRD